MRNIASKKRCQECGGVIALPGKRAERRETFCTPCVNAIEEKYPSPKVVMTNRKCRECGENLPSTHYFTHEQCGRKETDTGDIYPDTLYYSETFSREGLTLAARLSKLEKEVKDELDARVISIPVCRS